MFPEFGPQPSRRPEESEIDSYDLSDLRNPERQSPLLAQHLLHLAYLDVARAGLAEGNQLLLLRDQFSFEDRAVFDFMETQVRSEISRTLASAGRATDSPGLQVRFLHSLVALSPTARERHMYVEIVSECRNSVLAHRGTVQVFTEGPVALHVYSPDSSEPQRLVQTQRVSRQAFQEGLVSLFRDVGSGGSATMSGSWAWRWALESVQRAEEFQQAVVAWHHKHSSSGDSIPIKLRLTAESLASVRLQVELESLVCEVLLQHDAKRQEPQIHTYIESSGRAA